MSIKEICLIPIFPLILGIAANHYNHQIDRQNKTYGSTDSITKPQEIFKISRDTIRVSIEGKLSRALLIHDKYYALYYVRDPMSTCPIKKFYILEKNGGIEKEINVPEEIHNDTYPKLYYWHGRIIVNTEFYKKTYYLDENKGEFIKSPNVITVPLFEDENCVVTSECHGEFGSKIYFKNKLTGAIYSGSTECPFLVNKLRDKYLINTSGMPYNAIMEINDPTSSPAGTKLTAQEVFQYDFASHFYIPTSFVVDGALYHIYNYYHEELDLSAKKEKVVITKDSVKIGIIDNGEFRPLYKFKDKFDIELQQRLSSDYQICTFHTESRIQIGFKKDIPPYMERKYGLIEIMDNQIKIHYFISNKRG